MRVLGVLDVTGGRAVRARGGRRRAYQPVESVAGIRIDGDAVALARVYVDQLGASELYAADLDAIETGLGQGKPIEAIAAVAPLWLDAGVTSADAARRALDAGASMIVVGLETLPSFDVLVEICDAVDGSRVALSLDLFEGQTIAPAGSPAARLPTPEIARQGLAAGVRALILLDLARVGSYRGLDLEIVRQLRGVSGDAVLLAGGGVRGPADLAALAEAGCDGALCASAIHDGRIGAADIAAARLLQRTSSR